MKHAREDYNRIQDPEGKIPLDEPVFLLRGQDAFSEETVRYWGHLAREHELHCLATLAFIQADRMKDWPKKKLPDLPTPLPALTMDDFQPGDVVRHKHGSEGYIITATYRGYAIAVRTSHISNPSEWEIIRKGRP